MLKGGLPNRGLRCGFDCAQTPGGRYSRLTAFYGKGAEHPQWKNKKQKLKMKQVSVEVVILQSCILLYLPLYLLLYLIVSRIFIATYI